MDQIGSKYKFELLKSRMILMCLLCWFLPDTHSFGLNSASTQLSCNSRFKLKNLHPLSKIPTLETAAVRHRFTARVALKSLAGDTSEGPFPPIQGPITTTTISVRAPLQICFDSASDFDNYLEWSQRNGMKSVRVLARDPRGRGLLVEFTAGAIGLDVRNVVAYRYPADGASIEFRLRSGDVIQRLEGRYTFASVGPGETKMTYELGIGFAFSLPDFAREQISGSIARTALDELRRHIEGRARRLQVRRRFGGGDGPSAGSAPPPA
jgi:hypothetical protein